MKALVAEGSKLYLCNVNFIKFRCILINNQKGCNYDNWHTCTQGSSVSGDFTLQLVTCKRTLIIVLENSPYISEKNKAVFRSKFMQNDLQMQGTLSYMCAKFHNCTSYGCLAKCT
jgi:hypothetical protein